MLLLSKIFYETNIFLWSRLRANGVRMGVRGLAPGKFFETAPCRMRENSIFCEISRRNHVLLKSISRNNYQIFGKSRCTTESSITNSRVENIKITKSRAQISQITLHVQIWGGLLNESVILGFFERIVCVTIEHFF